MTSPGNNVCKKLAFEQHVAKEITAQIKHFIRNYEPADMKDNSKYLVAIDAAIKKLKDDVDDEMRLRKCKERALEKYMKPCELAYKLYNDIPVVTVPRRDKKIITYPTDLFGNGSIMKPMKPVDDVETLSILYDKLCHEMMESEGRCKYLRLRNKKSPQDKFHFPVLSSMEYGWNYDDENSMMPTKKIYARNEIVKDTFYRPHGVFNVNKKQYNPF
ncbi:hypothetical protein SNEBB_006218 [Seison nebaliae]|nr:hypothetical protein SNEBB_006218 [Seison nebaliae]